MGRSTSYRAGDEGHSTPHRPVYDRLISICRQQKGGLIIASDIERLVNEVRTEHDPGPAPAPRSDEVIAAAARELRRQNDEARDLLRRIRGWDHLPLTGDGPFWMREIDRVMGSK